MSEPKDELPNPAANVHATMTIPGIRRAKATVQRISLRAISGPDEGKVWTNQEDRCVIGTHPSVDVPLTDRTVSRFHCELVVEPSAVILTDLDSRNGTFVDRVRVMKCQLHEGAVISVGETDLKVEPADGVAEIALSEATRFGRMVGESEPMRRVFAVLERASKSDATILLTGETGTGKEAAAESIHEESKRKDGPFVVVDCSALPPNLLESELFGHEKGSFTGAIGSRVGAFEAANGGTVFLDEIGELPLDLQPKLLRVLEKRQIKRVGASRYVDVDVRVLAATNRDLKQAVNAKTFRSDIYFRLAVLEVRLPALRTRPEDLPTLVARLLEGRRDVTGEVARFLQSASFLSSLARHPWPGNVRELRNHLERCIALQEAVDLEAGGVQTEGEGTGLVIDASLPYSEARKDHLRAFERAYLEALLADHDDNVSAAARTAKLDRAQLYRLLWRTGLRERT